MATARKTKIKASVPSTIVPKEEKIDPESFTTGYASWNSPRFQGRQSEVDAALSANRGMRSRSGLDRTIAVHQATADKVTNKPAVREKSAHHVTMAKIMKNDPGVKDVPTTINDIAGRYTGFMDQAVDRGIATGQATGGTAWYFEQRRQQESNAAPGVLNPRQVTAMGAKLSAGKTPEDESVAMGGISRLVGPLADRNIDSRPVREHTGAEIGEKASAAAAHASYEEAGRRSKPTAPKPDAEPEVYSALRDAGRAHQKNTAVATDIARGDISPHEGFGEGTPKTRAYGEMQAQSTPGSTAEVDYRNVTSHFRDIRAGTQTSGQGMLMFSQEEPGPRHHTLASDTPTAIDTWMIAAGSGQPITATHPDTGRAYSPAKRMADKLFPHDMSGGTKTEMGLKGTDLSTGEAISAQHNEAIRRVSEEHIGAISHDQFGQDIHVPASHIQEAVWTESRRQAGWDPEFNAAEREQTRGERTASRTAAANAKKADKAQGRLFL